MRLVGKSKLEKYKSKNKGNKNLCKEIDKLISDIEISHWQSQIELKETRRDADCVHSDGFYFFNLLDHRAMILVEFSEEGEATVVWVGEHDTYERIFQNNRETIKNWLKAKDYI